MKLTDNIVLAKIMELLENGLPGHDVIPDGYVFEVQQKQQPTKQGVPVVATVYFEKLFDTPYGWTAVSYKDNPTAGPLKLSQAESQLYATSFQISTMVLQDPSDITQPTASDLALAARAVMQSRNALDEFALMGIGILRSATPVTNTYAADDQDRQEASPSFDIVLTYARELTTTIDAIARIEGIVASVKSNP